MFVYFQQLWERNKHVNSFKTFILFPTIPDTTNIFIKYLVELE